MPIEGNSVLKNFHVSEKSARLQGLNQYVFAVTAKANKSEIKKQVSRQYKVKVTAVNILRRPAKTIKVGGRSGTKPGFKKAVVTLVEGDKIAEANQ